MSGRYRYRKDIDLYVKNRGLRREDARRQEITARAVLERFEQRPGVILADEVGMGKTFVALAVAASIIARDRNAGPVVVMVPPGLKTKWPRDWTVFRDECISEATRAMIRVTETAVESGVDFLKLLGERASRRKNMIFLTHGALSKGLRDPWVKLALVKRAMRKKSLAHIRNAFPRFASEFLQMKVRMRDPHVYNHLWRRQPKQWKEILGCHGIALNSDPVPAHLIKAIDHLREEDIDDLAHALASLPQRESDNVGERIVNARRDAGPIFQKIWEGWLSAACHHINLPLLILDEAHHLKNPDTVLSSLFMEEGAEEEARMLVGPLNGVFRRMLFLTATPFQLGHYELMNVLERFKNVSWRQGGATRRGRDDIVEEIKVLSSAMDSAQASALSFDAVWGRLRPEYMHDEKGNSCTVDVWWKRLLRSKDGDEGLGSEIRRRYQQAHDALSSAEELLQPWVIRHRKPQMFTGSKVQRRLYFPGAAILDEKANGGIEIKGKALLPFLLVARATAISWREAQRALFAEGLASSYEAYRETRSGKGERDEDDECDGDDGAKARDLEWYLSNLDLWLPPEKEKLLAAHPKIAATVERAVRLWRKNEKVLIFCHYRATGRALSVHLSRRLDDEIMLLMMKRFGLRSRKAARRQIRIIGERLMNKEDRLRREAEVVFDDLLRRHKAFTQNDRRRIVKIMLRFMRTPSFIARYMPIIVRRKRDIIATALMTADQSGETLQRRMVRFCELLGYQCTREERDEYLAALSDINTGGHRVQGDRTLANVRLANGDTDDAARRRLMLSFNTPLFPEILVSSSVLGEGVDLHLDCQNVIHHDLCWNPSTIEQRTGRIDRLRSKAESTRRPMNIYLPYVAATQDEKMYRVVRDRERWFQVVMGEKYAVDEISTDRFERRVPLPEDVAREMAFKLDVFKHE